MSIRSFVLFIQNISSKNNASIFDSSKPHGSDNVINSVIDKYKEHPSIELIAVNIPEPNTYTFRKGPKDGIIKTIKGLDSTTATGIDRIPPELVKLACDIIPEPLTSLISSTLIDCHLFPLREKVATVTPIFKKDDKLSKKNYRPISVLNVFSKVFKRHILNQMMPFFDKIQSKFISAYRSRYSSQHVLLRLIEEWRKCLDEIKVVGAILMDLSKAFDCLPHDLLIAKLEAYGLDRGALKLLLSYLNNRKQSVKVKGVKSILQLIKNSVPQGSILGPILFSIFINDIYYVLQSDLHNFADDNTISAIFDTVSGLVNSLTDKTNKAVD